MMNNKEVIEDLQAIKDSFIAGTNGSYPVSLDYAITLLKKLPDNSDLRLIDSQELMRKLLDVKDKAITYDFGQGLLEAIQIVAGMEVVNETGSN